MVLQVVSDSLLRSAFMEFILRKLRLVFCEPIIERNAIPIYSVPCTNWGKCIIKLVNIIFMEFLARPYPFKDGQTD